MFCVASLRLVAAMHIVRRSPLVLLAGLFVALASQGVAYAADTPTSGITVAPANLTLSLPKGQSVQDGVISIRNNATKTVHLSANIGGIQETNNGSFAPSHTIEPALAKVLSIAQTDIVLDGGRSINLKVQVRDTPELTPGGHYASVLIRDIETEGGNVVLSHAVSVRIFIIKETGAVRSVNIDGISDNGGLFRVPSVTTVTFGNPGNVGVVPRASINIYDPRGRLVANGVLNTESVTVQPGKQAQLRTVLTGLAHAWWPGSYEQRITYRYEGSDEQLTGSVRLFVIPPLCIALCLIGLSTIAGVTWLIQRFWPRREGVFVLKRPHSDGPRSQDISGAHPVQRKSRRIDVV